jgi:hypothetical protein
MRQEPWYDYAAILPYFWVHTHFLQQDSLRLDRIQGLSNEVRIDRLQAINNIPTST